jgi:hypothetical protein
MALTFLFGSPFSPSLANAETKSSKGWRSCGSDTFWRISDSLYDLGALLGSDCLRFQHRRRFRNPVLATDLLPDVLAPGWSFGRGRSRWDKAIPSRMVGSCDGQTWYTAYCGFGYTMPGRVDFLGFVLFCRRCLGISADRFGLLLIAACGLRIRVPGATIDATLAYSVYLTHKQVMHLDRIYLKGFVSFDDQPVRVGGP